MRIAIQNPFVDPFVAEAELSRRIYLAAKTLGWEAIEVHTSEQIRLANPDFVIALHNNSPKLAGYPTYGCMWNPPSFFEGTEKFVKHVFSYDGYLVSSKPIDRWLFHLLYNTNKPYFTAPFYTSCPQTQYQPPHLENPRLMYIGSNWDGLRFQSLFEALDHQPYMDVYGNPNGWTHLQHAYKGSLPYDGISVLETLNRAGVGLCLHREEHCQAEAPSMRIFEIVASGAIAICGEHPFIRQAFGDSVLYIDPTPNEQEQVKQISQHMAWIQQNPAQALEMSATAHQLFSEQYSLEKLLLDLVPYHHDLISKKGFVASGDRPSLQPQVQLMMRVGGRDVATIRRALDSIAHQTYQNVAVIVVQYQDVVGLEQLLNQYTARMPIKLIQSPPTGFRSTQLWAGLNAVDSEYFAILDDDDVIHPNHIHTLVSLLQHHPDAGVAYSGALWVLEPNLEPNTTATAPSPSTVELAYFSPFNLDELLKFRNFIPSNSYVARSALLDPVLKRDPELKVFEDVCLLLHLCKRTRFLFSYEATAEFYWRTNEQDNSTFSGKPLWSHEMSRLKFIFWRQEFAPGKSIQTVQQIEIEYPRLRAKVKELQAQLQAAETTIEAMETSKFWRLRKGWFKVKRMLKLPVNG
ncbi:glycosyltransferase family 2 protein [Oculatella sp. LEGE 06141]|uniref:glycosyltransferase n=1 Tax=Oculatella sp. LEGE 06141 TaxID=1828648 RepID=UPI00187DFFB4|nr:glycosyltransferase family 2 protein [Oculatella sp. LEGE 06141]MBE9178290.1 glycosyltransferase family 2 protein [Oculatella sp. LEGE 06141]